jgi:hypothetical protein
MKHYHVLIVVLFLLVVQAGCGSDRPKGLEKLYPCQITLTAAGTAIPGATVILHSKTGEDRTFSGLTDTQGIAIIKSEFKYNGVPEGTYAVAFAKTPEGIVPKKSRAEINAMSMEEGQKYFAEYNASVRNAKKIIPDHLSIASASPLEITVNSSSEHAFTFELDDYKVPPKNWKPPQH